MSKGVNRLLSSTSRSRLATVTGMVRAYDGPFIRGLDLKAMGPEINTEILYKAQILRARVVEIPAHLDWSAQTERMSVRKVNLRVSSTSKLLMFASFLFRPIVFFVIPGLVLLFISAWTLGSVGVAVLRDTLNGSGSVDSRLYDAFASTWASRPQSFIVGGFSFVVAVQLISLGVLATQTKRYFEELFHLGTSVVRRVDRLEQRADVTAEDLADVPAMSGPTPTPPAPIGHSRREAEVLPSR
jgi:hypothetical protein